MILDRIESESEIVADVLGYARFTAGTFQIIDAYLPSEIDKLWISGHGLPGIGLHA